MQRWGREDDLGGITASNITPYRHVIKDLRLDNSYWALTLFLVLCWEWGAERGLEKITQKSS